ncbi:MAG: YdbL family protein [Methylococcales bacterium]|nr:YdbL family protein [Methylococcales bacterium]
MKKLSIFSALLLTACVTINIYFPAAAAEKAADTIIKDIQSVTPVPKPKAELNNWQKTAMQWLDKSINLIIPAAQAAEADLTIDSNEIRQLRTKMESRFSNLSGFYTAGYIGIQADGLLAIREATTVPLQERNAVNSLVGAENADRNALYQAIANANGHPDWVADIKATFAKRWIGNAQAGWWYQSAGNWVQK